TCMNSKQARVLIALFFGLTFVYLAWGFFVPVVLGAAIALLLHPLFDYLVVRKNWKPQLASALLTFGVTVLLILPATLLTIRGVRFAVRRIGEWRDSPFANAPGGDQTLLESLINIPGASALLERTAAALRMETYEVSENVAEVLKTAGVKLANWLGGLLSSLPTFAIGLFLLILGIYFFLADGTRLVRFFRMAS